MSLFSHVLHFFDYGTGVNHGVQILIWESPTIGLRAEPLANSRLI